LKTPPDNARDAFILKTEIEERLERMEKEDAEFAQSVTNAMRASENLAQLIGITAISLSFLGWGVAFLLMALGVNLWVSFAVFTSVGLAGLFLSIRTVRNRLTATISRILSKIRRRA